MSGHGILRLPTSPPCTEIGRAVCIEQSCALSLPSLDLSSSAADPQTWVLVFVSGGPCQACNPLSTSPAPPFLSLVSVLESHSPLCRARALGSQWNFFTSGRVPKTHIGGSGVCTFRRSPSALPPPAWLLACALVPEPVLLSWPIHLGQPIFVFCHCGACLLVSFGLVPVYLQVSVAYSR